MEQYWNDHAEKGGATLNAMMLDKNAQNFSDKEKQEVMSLIPDLKDKTVLELGAGIGRITSGIYKQTKKLVAVEFIKQFHDENIAVHGSAPNIQFINDNCMNLSFQPNSFDVIFSNWLMMYLTDEEIEKLVQKMLVWLKPGGYFFFRESCYHQSGTRTVQEQVNPTIYRAPEQYTALITQSSAEVGFDVVYSKPIQTYIEEKNNKNQICWLVEKTVRDITGVNQGEKTFQKFLDKQQYSKNGILRYERIFGKDYVSSGGLETTVEFCKQLDMKRGQKVLDIGFGIGGSAFHFNQVYGCDVLGIDLSTNMVDIGIQKLKEYGYSGINFEVADATKREFEAESYDLVYSRDTILHIEDKLNLFKNFYKWTKPGGQCFITDYCAGPRSMWDKEFTEYVASRGYHLHTPEDYGKILEQAGFCEVKAIDNTAAWREVLEAEIAKIEGPLRKEFLNDFSEKDLNDLVSGWKAKLVRVDSGCQRWGVFYAKKK